jgi:hypothetical protein
VEKQRRGPCWVSAPYRLLRCAAACGDIHHPGWFSSGSSVELPSGSVRAEPPASLNVLKIRVLCRLRNALQVQESCQLCRIGLVFFSSGRDPSKIENRRLMVGTQVAFSPRPLKKDASYRRRRHGSCQIEPTRAPGSNRPAIIQRRPRSAMARAGGPQGSHTGHDVGPSQSPPRSASGSDRLR